MDIDLELSAKAGTSSINPGPSAAGDSAGAKQQQPKGNIMAASGTIASVTISLHPLVIMNISEHWTRFRAQHGEPRQVYGALIGKQKGRNIEVMNSFELKTDEIADETIINRDYYNKKEQQYKQVMQFYKFLRTLKKLFFDFYRCSVILISLAGIQRATIPLRVILRSKSR